MVVINVKKMLNYVEIYKKGLIMTFICSIIKSIFAMEPQTCLVGLSGLRKTKKIQKTKTVRSKKSEPKLSELMKKNH